MSRDYPMHVYADFDRPKCAVCCIESEYPPDDAETMVFGTAVCRAHVEKAVKLGRPTVADQLVARTLGR